MIAAKTIHTNGTHEGDRDLVYAKQADHIKSSPLRLQFVFLISRLLRKSCQGCCLCLSLAYGFSPFRTSLFFNPARPDQPRAHRAGTGESLLRRLERERRRWDRPRDYQLKWNREAHASCTPT